MNHASDDKTGSRVATLPCAAIIGSVLGLVGPVLFVGWLLNVPATCQTIVRADTLG